MAASELAHLPTGTVLLELISELAQSNRELAVHIWHDKGRPTPDDWTPAQADSFHEFLASVEPDERDEIAAEWLAQAPLHGYALLQGPTEQAADETLIAETFRAVREAVSPEEALAAIRAGSLTLSRRHVARRHVARRTCGAVPRVSRPGRARGGRRRTVSRRVGSSRGSPGRSTDGEPPHLARRAVAA